MQFTFGSDVAFAQNNAGNLFLQCKNGPFGTPVLCEDLGMNRGWQNGNAGKGQAHFFEGESQSYIILLTGIETVCPADAGSPGSTLLDGTNPDVLDDNCTRVNGNPDDFLNHHRVDFKVKVIDGGRIAQDFITGINNHGIGLTSPLELPDNPCDGIFSPGGSHASLVTFADAAACEAAATKLQLQIVSSTSQYLACLRTSLTTRIILYYCRAINPLV